MKSQVMTFAFQKHTVQFKDQTRYRVVENEETQLDLAEGAIQRALEHANLNIKDIDCLVSASEVGVHLSLVRLP